MELVDQEDQVVVVEEHQLTQVRVMQVVLETHLQLVLHKEIMVEQVMML
tara:strand:+ start:83 stop:229 length:147 start_codon:yes stop_codon:yes gene_type:complete